MAEPIHITVPAYLPKFSIGKKISIPPSLKKRSAENMICNMFILPVGKETSAEIMSVQQVNENVDSSDANEVTSGFTLVVRDKKYYLIKNSRAFRVPENWGYVFERHPVDNNTKMQWVQIRRSQSSGDAGYIYHQTAQGYLPVEAIEELMQHAPENKHLRVHKESDCPLLQLQAPAKEPTVHIVDVFLSGDPEHSTWSTLHLVYHATHVLPCGGFAAVFRVRCPVNIQDINDASYCRGHTQAVNRSFSHAYVQQLEQIADYPAMSYAEAQLLWPAAEYPDAFRRMAMLPKIGSVLTSLRTLLRTEEGVGIFEDSIEFGRKPAKSTVVGINVLDSDDGYLSLCKKGFRIFLPNREEDIHQHVTTETGRVVSHRVAGYLRTITGETNKVQAMLLSKNHPQEMGYLRFSSGKLLDGRHYVSGLLIMESGWVTDLQKNKLIVKSNYLHVHNETVACRILIVEHTLESCARALRELVQELAPQAIVIEMQYRDPRVLTEQSLNIYGETFNCTASAAAQLKTLLIDAIPANGDTQQATEAPLPM